MRAPTATRSASVAKISRTCIHRLIEAFIRRVAFEMIYPPATIEDADCAAFKIGLTRA